MKISEVTFKEGDRLKFHVAGVKDVSTGGPGVARFVMIPFPGTKVTVDQTPNKPQKWVPVKITMPDGTICTGTFARCKAPEGNVTGRALMMSCYADAPGNTSFKVRKMKQLDAGEGYSTDLVKCSADQFEVAKANEKIKKRAAHDSANKEAKEPSNKRADVRPDIPKLLADVPEGQPDAHPDALPDVRPAGKSLFDTLCDKMQKNFEEYGKSGRDRIDGELAAYGKSERERIDAELADYKKKQMEKANIHTDHALKVISSAKATAAKIEENAHRRAKEIEEIAAFTSGDPKTIQQNIAAAMDARMGKK